MEEQTVCHKQAMERERGTYSRTRFSQILQGILGQRENKTNGNGPPLQR